MTKPPTIGDGPALPYSIRLALPLIKEAEGFHATPYQCPALVWTIGYGHTRLDGRPVNKNTRRIEEPEALALLVRTMEEDMLAIRKSAGIYLLQEEMAALLSFVHNFGMTKFRSSTMAKHIYHGRMQDAANEFPKWSLSRGVTLRGLVKRREAERRLFLGHRNGVV